MTILTSTTEGDNPSHEITGAWLTYAQASAYTSLSRCTLWRILERGDIEAARVGRAVRFSRESLDEFMRSRCG